jgi:SAM-dependent methyltransferase
MAEYDGITEEYSQVHEGDMVQRRYIFDPSFMKALGDLSGLRVLDLACGSGYFTRKIRLAGAREVTGLDVSSGMARLAEEEEKRNPLGIKYIVMDASKPRRLGEFDLVSAAFLLHYSETREELLGMCKTAYMNLADGRRFLALGPDPRHPLARHSEYGFVIEGKEPVREGDRLTTRLFSNGKEQCSFTHYHWERGTYENALRNAGFRGIRWIPLEVSEEGIERYGEGFWRGFLDEPPTTMIEAAR